MVEQLKKGKKKFKNELENIKINYNKKIKNLKSFK